MSGSEKENGEEFLDDSTGEEEDSRIEDIEDEEVGSGPGAVKRLREKLKKTIEEKQEYLDGWQRSRADLSNFKRDELQREGEREIRSKVDFAEAVIPALDAFEMALKDKNYQTGDENIKKGIDAVYSNLLRSLERIGIIRFDPSGESFNPHQHEALREVPTEVKEKDHTIESVHRAGFKVILPDGTERIIRPAQVSVYSHSEK